MEEPSSFFTAQYVSNALQNIIITYHIPLTNYE